MIKVLEIKKSNIFKIGALLNLSLFVALFLASGCSKNNAVDSSDNEDDSYQDILTPGYYNSTKNDSFIIEVNSFLDKVRMLEFHHPLENNSGQIPSFSVPANGEFGAGKGPTGTSEHHPATDLHIGNGETNVILYAAHGGFVTTVKDAEKYRQYLSITKEVLDDSGQFIGKLVTLYAHIDLDLDEED